MAKQTIENKYGWSFLNFKLKKNVENVDPVQLGIISSGSIPGYLKVAVKSKKDRVLGISYEITGCERLKEFLSSHVMYRKLFVSIALEMVDALIMREKRHLVYSYIKTDYNEIFIDKNRLEIKFLYYPLQGVSNNESITDFLRKLPDLCFFAPQEQTSYVTEYIGYLSNLRKQFNLIDFRDFLIQLDDEIAQRYSTQTANSLSEKESVGQNFTGNRNAIYSNQDGKHGKIYITPISLSSGMISGTQIASHSQGIPNNSPNPQGNPAVQPFSNVSSVRPDCSMENKISVVNEVQKPLYEPKGTTVLGAGSYEEHETTVLGGALHDEGTTPLGGSYSPKSDLPQIRATITRLRTGEERVVNKDIFLIGKNISQVDFAISDNSTISRTHATISRKGGHFFLKDNHSLNGTFVNGKTVEEYDEIELLNGTKILLSDEEFIFGIDEMVKKYE